MVLRVSTMRAPVPVVSATYRAVSVAIPHMRWTKLRPTRSACSTAQAGPVTSASTAPVSKETPSSINPLTRMLACVSIMAAEKTAPR